MGVVYLVQDERLGRRVALKVIVPELAEDPEFRERFEGEARSAAAIEHPNAVPIYSAGSADGNLFIAMRYIDGTDLREYLAESGPLEPTAAARVVREVGSALDAAHTAGFVHRDVKPANILLTGEPGRGTAYLTDFGLTRGLGSHTQLTGTGQWIGTLDYVAPEQMAAGRVDARTDIYSLGCVLYEMLAGSVPYPGDDMQKLWGKANEQPPVLPDGSRAKELDAVIRRAMARDPKARFRSAGDLGLAASAAAGAATDRPTERSVATGVAAAGLVEGSVPPQPRRPSAREQPTIRLPVADGPGRGVEGRRSSGFVGALIVLGAVLLAAGLVVGALLLSGSHKEDSSTVVHTARATESTTTTTAPAKVPSAAEAEASPSTTESTTTFYGSLYSVEIPAGWVQEEDEAPASDGSYVENTWINPDGSEALKIDESPGHPADPAESAAGIAAGLRSAGEAVYAVTDNVDYGGVIGSEIAFRNDQGLPERIDFFFNLGGNGFAVLGSAYDLDTARALVGPVVSSLRTTG
jgi:hypothetical protein